MPSHPLQSERIGLLSEILRFTRHGHGQPILLLSQLASFANPCSPELDTRVFLDFQAIVAVSCAGRNADIPVRDPNAAAVQPDKKLTPARISISGDG
jgi:hypothetical protein